MRKILALLLTASLTAATEPVAPAEAAGAGNDFALRLYRELAAKRDGNLAFSPTSIHTALCMTYAGARGVTAAEMRQVLALPDSAERVAMMTRLLHASLLKKPPAGRGRGLTLPAPPKTEITIANSLFGQRGEKFLPSFLGTMKTAYGAPLQLVDFAGATEAARNTINGWVHGRTNERIEELLKPDVLNRNTALVLVNALTFKAQWTTPFSERWTTPKPFYFGDGKPVQVPTMHRTGAMRYAETEVLQAVEVPYGGNRFTMLLLVPRAVDGLAAIERATTAKSLATLVKGMRYKPVSIALPKWKTTSAFSLAENLKDLGMKTAFGGGADFSGMNGKQDLFISAVEHKAFVAVDEAGTEAAAATAVVMGRKGKPRSPVTLKANRPFLYSIRDRETGALLFLGRVTDPR